MIVAALGVTGNWPRAERTAENERQASAEAAFAPRDERDERGLGRQLCVIMRQPSPTHEAFSLIPTHAVCSPRSNPGLTAS